MSKIAEDLQAFLTYAKLLDGDEKGESQVFCDRLFQAFGHKGYKEAGASLEFRIKKQSSKGTSFADLIWKPRLLLEMKKRGEKLQLHYRQAWDYWVNAVPDRPRYVVLCNFDEFWIYDFDRQLDEPVDKLRIEELPLRHTALNFLFPRETRPIFGNDREDVSRKAANQMAELFKLLTKMRSKGPVPREQAQRLILQLVIAMFAEDIDLLPAGTITSLVRDCRESGQSSYDMLGGLFRQMNDPTPARGGRFQGVPYFNGGLFSEIQPVELNEYELQLIGDEKEGAASKNWAKVNPAIFGTLFQQSMDAKEQHQHGRHFTSETDILRIVSPTIARPWEKRIDAARSLGELVKLREELATFRVLDPACGSGNFLYVAYREVARLDIRLMLRLKEMVSAREFLKQARLVSAISPKQFFGIDNDPFGVELAKVTLMLAKKLAHDEAVRELFDDAGEYQKGVHELALDGDDSLPLDNLEDNVRLGDAMFDAWPECDAIVGNPPYQSKNKLQEELGPAYLDRLRETHPEIDGRADFCVYWFRLAHDHLKSGQRAGLVGTNTIRQNYSRMGGLDYIVDHGGEIVEAVSSMKWPGAAELHVSIANWIKGTESGAKRLYIHVGEDLESGWRFDDIDRIPSSLSFSLDVTKAKTLTVNARKGGCYQGQTHGHKSFLMKAPEASLLIKTEPKYAKVLKPFLTAEELIGEIGSKPQRYVIDFTGMDVLEAESFSKVFKRVKDGALPEREKAAAKETERNSELQDKKRGNQHHANFLRHWWQLSYPRDEMMESLAAKSRFVVCGRVTKRPIFEFVSTSISPNDSLAVFDHADDYTFGILQSSIHWEWFVNRCSTLTERFRYTSNTVFDSFPWPQSPSLAAVKAVAAAAVALRAKRRELCAKHNFSLRKLYASMEQPGSHPLKDATATLDAAVRKAYGMTPAADPLKHLLALNFELAEAEARGDAITGPGLPPCVNDATAFVTDDAIRPYA
jgi:SAM-dependent methyltransferase